MAIGTKKPSHEPRRAEDVDAFRQSLALGEALRHREETLVDTLRQRIDTGITFVRNEAAARADATTAALLHDPGADLTTVLVEKSDTGSLEAERAAVRRAIEVWSNEHARLADQVAGQLWSEDYESADLEIRREIVQHVIAAGEAQLRLRQHRALASRNGCLPGGKADRLPWINCANCATLPRALETLANFLPAFRETNRNLLSTKDVTR